MEYCRKCDYSIISCLLRVTPLNLAGQWGGVLDNINISQELSAGGDKSCVWRVSLCYLSAFPLGNRGLFPHLRGFYHKFWGDCCGYVVIFSSASFNSNRFKTKLFPDIQSNAGQRIKLWWNIAFVNLKMILKDFSIPSNNSRHTPSLSFWMLEVIFTTVSSVAATVTGGFWARLFVVVF